MCLTSILFVGCNEIEVTGVEFNKSEPIVLVKGSSNFEVYSNIIEDNSKLVASVLPKNASNKKSKSACKILHEAES